MKQSGFTIIELLIVATIIGILVTIGVVSYGGYTKRAHDTAVRSDFDGLSGLLESFRTKESNTAHQFPRTKTPDLDSLGFRATKASYDQTIENNLIYCVSLAADNYQSYAVVAISKSGNSIVITQDGFKTTTSSTFSKSEFNDSSALCHSLDDKGLTSLDMGVVSSGMYDPGVWQAWTGS